MSLRSHRPVPSVPEQTRLVARAAFPRGSVYLLLRDELGPLFDDACVDTRSPAVLLLDGPHLRGARRQRPGEGRVGAEP